MAELPSCSVSRGGPSGGPVSAPLVVPGGSGGWCEVEDAWQAMMIDGAQGRGYLIITTSLFQCLFTGGKVKSLSVSVWLVCRNAYENVCLLPWSRPDSPGPDQTYSFQRVFLYFFPRRDQNQITYHA